MPRLTQRTSGCASSSWLTDALGGSDSPGRTSFPDNPKRTVSTGQTVACLSMPLTVQNRSRGNLSIIKFPSPWPALQCNVGYRKSKPRSLGGRGGSVPHRGSWWAGGGRKEVESCLSFSVPCGQMFKRTCNVAGKTFEFYRQVLEGSLSAAVQRGQLGT